MATQRSESASHHNLPIRLHDQAAHVTARSGIKGVVQAAVGVQSPDRLARLPAQTGKSPPHHNLPIGLCGQADHTSACPQIEGRIEAAICI